MLHDFELAGRRVRAWQRPGESYEHVLMKALGYAMYIAEFPALEIEAEVGLRYKPDLVARGAAADGRGGRFQFWGECGTVTVRKIAWLLKHGAVERLVVFKINYGVAALASELRAAIGNRHRAPGRLLLVNFAADIVARAAHRRIARVPQSWYTTTVV